MEIKDIKQQLNIQTVLNHYGVKADKNGMANCPFHSDKTPSFQIYPKSNTYCCFSSNCSAGTGDQIQFIELKEKQGKHQAILKAKELLGVKEPSLNEIFSKLKQNVNKSPRAKQYIESRNLRLQNLEVGFNANGYKDLKNCIIFPLKDKFNNVVSLYGRSLNKGHYYTENRKGLFPKYPPAETRKLILTESIIDAVTLLQQKEITAEYEVLALYGTNGFTQEHTEAIKELNHLKEIILFFDGDEAGEKAIAKYSKELSINNCQISIIETPKGEDVNSLLDGHSSEIFTELLNSRKNGSTKRQLKIEEAKPIQNDSIKTIDEQEEAKEENQLPAVAHRLNTENPDYITYEKGDLKCVLLGGISIQQIDRLRVTLLLERVPKLSPLHSIRQSGLDLYNDSFVEKFGRTAAEKLEIGTSEIRLIIAELIEALEKYRLSQIESKREVKPQFRILNKQQKETALKYLKAPNLLKRTNADIGKSGMIGEEVNRLLMYLVFTSRLRENPLNIICLGASGTGKTHLQEKVAELIPENDIIDATALSDNALYYFERTALKHKLIVIEDMDGAENVLYQLRELMSKKKLSKQVVIKDSKGNMRTIQTQTEGPICVTGTTTQERIYEDNANRSLLLYLDGSKQHQEKIMDYQRRASAGIINHQEEEGIKNLFKDMQSLLKPIRIVNPYATQLKIPQEVFKPLRSNAHYLQFIECITFYHQWQRHKHKDKNTGEDYIKTTLEDIAAANALLKDVLLDKADELSGACRKFFEVLKHHLKQEKKQSFYAKDIRANLRLNPKTLSRYLYDLQRYNYVKIVGGDKFRKGYEYEIVNYEEFNNLENNIKTALDEALDKIKKNN